MIMILLKTKPWLKRNPVEFKISQSIKLVLLWLLFILSGYTHYFCTSDSGDITNIGIFCVLFVK